MPILTPNDVMRFRVGAYKKIFAVRVKLNKEIERERERGGGREREREGGE